MLSQDKTLWVYSRPYSREALSNLSTMCSNTSTQKVRTIDRWLVACEKKLSADYCEKESSFIVNVSPIPSDEPGASRDAASNIEASTITNIMP